MPISIPTTRNKIVTVNSVPTVLEAGAPQEVQGTESFFFPLVASAPITPQAFTVAACGTTISSAIVTTSGSFANVRVGDVVTGTGIAVDNAITVTAVTSATQITISEPATATGASVTLTFTPPAITPTYYGIQLQHSSVGSVITIQSIVLHKYDGTLGGTLGTTTNSVAKINLAPVVGSIANALQIDIDAFLTALRVQKTS